MIVNNLKKFVFVSVPKTGCTSIMVQLDSSPGILMQPPPIYHSQLDTLVGHDDYFKFGFVRHPVDRFLSTYIDGIRDPGHIRDWAGSLLNYATPNEFCANLHNEEVRNEVHFIPQHRFFYKDGVCIASKIYRYENFAESCHDISQRIGIYVHAGVRMRATQRDTDYTKYLSDASIRILYDFYRRDFDLFNYEIPPAVSLLH